MKTFKITGAFVALALLASCAAGPERDTGQTVIDDMRADPAPYEAICKTQTLSPKLTQQAALQMRVPPAEASYQYCHRVMTALIEGRITAEQYNLPDIAAIRRAVATPN